MTPGYPPPSLGDWPIGLLASRIPFATLVFRRRGIDVCVSAHKTLSQMSITEGFDLANAANELNELVSPDRSNVPGDMIPLIGHTEERQTALRVRYLPELIDLARDLEEVYRAHPELPVGLTDALVNLATILEIHACKESTVLFPLMKRPQDESLSQAIGQMRFEHEVLQDLYVTDIENLTNHFRAPLDCCPLWPALYISLRRFIDDLKQTIELEDQQIFAYFQ